MKVGLILAIKQRYEFATKNEELVTELKEMKDQYKKTIRKITPRTFARDWL